MITDGATIPNCPWRGRDALPNVHSCTRHQPWTLHEAESPPTDSVRARGPHPRALRRARHATRRAGDRGAAAVRPAAPARRGHKARRDLEVSRAATVPRARGDRPAYPAAAALASIRSMLRRYESMRLRGAAVEGSEQPPAAVRRLSVVFAPSPRPRSPPSSTATATARAAAGPGCVPGLSSAIC